MSAFVPKTDLSDLYGSKLGQPIFICGAGPSIGFVDISEIHQFDVMCVNSAILLMPWDEQSEDASDRIWLSNDSLCMQWNYFWKKVVKSQCTRLIRESWAKYRKKLSKYKFRYFRATNRIDRFEPKGDLLGVSSIPTCLDLSIRMGYKQIFVLGMDHKCVFGKSHFWQFWPEKDWPRRNDKPGLFSPPVKFQQKVFDRNTKALGHLSRWCESHKIEIYNCSTRTRVEHFSQIPLDKAIEMAQQTKSECTRA